MSTKKWIWSIVITVIVLGVLAALGFAVYKLGYSRGMAAQLDDSMFTHPFLRHGIEVHGLESDSLPHLRFTDGQPFDRFVLNRTDGRWIFTPLSFAFRLIVLGVILWLGYKLITAIFRKPGWQFTFRTLDSDEEGSQKVTGRKPRTNQKKT